MKDTKNETPKQNPTASGGAKAPYQTPVLKEHGHAKDVTLQTFFGTFSPPASE